VRVVALEKIRAGRRNESPEEALFLDLARTVEALSHPLVQLLKGHELSMTQYNVLRILRGAPEGLTCGEAGNRMIARDPDITRLLDRLEKRKLVERARDEKDRRVVLVRITPQGSELLGALDRPVQDAHRRSLGHLGEERLARMSELLAACRAKAD
jgi:DNA-binding MarR family transcriptional regulator